MNKRPAFQSTNLEPVMSDEVDKLPDLAAMLAIAEEEKKTLRSSIQSQGCCQSLIFTRK